MLKDSSESMSPDTGHIQRADSASIEGRRSIVSRRRRFATQNTSNLLVTRDVIFCLAGKVYGRFICRLKLFWAALFSRFSPIIDSDAEREGTIGFDQHLGPLTFDERDDSGKLARVNERFCHAAGEASELERMCKKLSTLLPEEEDQMASESRRGSCRKTEGAKQSDETSKLSGVASDAKTGQKREGEVVRQFGRRSRQSRCIGGPPPPQPFAEQSALLAKLRDTASGSGL